MKMRDRIVGFITDFLLYDNVFCKQEIQLSFLCALCTVKVFVNNAATWFLLASGWTDTV